MKNKAGEFRTVQDLVDHLTQLGPERELIIDVDGNTYPCSEFDIELWHDIDPDSPVAIHGGRMAGIEN